MNDLKVYLSLKDQEKRLNDERNDCYSNIGRIKRNCEQDTAKLQQEIDGLDCDLEIVREKMKVMEEAVKEN